MSETQKHTPTPWRASKARKSSNFGAYVAFVQTVDPASVLAKVSGGPTDDREVAEANAAFIVRAVNAHDDLVKALGELADAIEEDQSSDPDMPSHGDTALRLERAVEGARAALSKAGA
jgi:type IV secretory pathway VirB10-like protein